MTTHRFTHLKVVMAISVLVPALAAGSWDAAAGGGGNKPMSARAITHGQSPPVEAIEVHSLLTDEWGVPHPAGLTYFPDEGSLLVAAAAPRGTDVLRLSPYEHALGTLTLPLISRPATMAFDAAGGRLTALSGSDLITVSAADLRQARPPVSRIPVTTLELQDPTGAAFDSATGTWFLLDNAARAVVRVPIQGDALGTPVRVSLRDLGSDPLQGLALNPADGLLYLASPEEGLLYGIDGSGGVERTYGLGALELGGTGLQDLRAMVFAPSTDPTDDPATQHLFIADAGGPSILGGVAEVLLPRRGDDDDFN